MQLNLRPVQARGVLVNLIDAIGLLAALSPLGRADCTAIIAAVSVMLTETLLRQL